MICKTVRYNRAIDLLNELLNCSPLSEKNAKHARKYRAELRAQGELAKFLAGALGKKPELLVFNNLQCDQRGITVQIDHLVLSRWAAYFIESTSASQKININIEAQWSRVYGKGKEFDYFDSPLEQSRTNQTLLLELLEARLPEFIAETPPNHPHFPQIVDAQHLVAVAVADDATVRGKGVKSILQHICDADKIATHILEHHQSVRSNSPANPNFTQEELTACRKLILKADTSQPPLAQVHEFVESLTQETDADNGDA
jgi:hypothetical protein